MSRGPRPCSSHRTHLTPLAVEDVLFSQAAKLTDLLAKVGRHGLVTFPRSETGFVPNPYPCLGALFLSTPVIGTPCHNVSDLVGPVLSLIPRSIPIIDGHSRDSGNTSLSVIHPRFPDITAQEERGRRGAFALHASPAPSIFPDMDNDDDDDDDSRGTDEQAGASTIRTLSQSSRPSKRAARANHPTNTLPTSHHITRLVPAPASRDHHAIPTMPCPALPQKCTSSSLLGRC
ncbi:hypothetical protein LZ30DRAFT_683152 [Colletotrichum cereale]|nr:hypothetical protein LZ30DRAFT_683152 [Colletotrichum cereale]